MKALLLFVLAMVGGDEPKGVVTMPENVLVIPVAEMRVGEMRWIPEKAVYINSERQVFVNIRYEATPWKYSTNTIRVIRETSGWELILPKDHMWYKSDGLNNINNAESLRPVLRITLVDK